ncbi:MAG: cytochrome c [Burkholderiales bacterium]|nr:cytochrome c [Burkholderiales bacterium]
MDRRLKIRDENRCRNKDRKVHLVGRNGLHLLRRLSYGIISYGAICLRQLTPYLLRVTTLGEKIRILGFLGSDAARFRGYDHQTHTAAEEMRSAAAKGDGKAAIAAYANVQSNCLACHQSFRKRFQEHFYALK